MIEYLIHMVDRLGDWGYFVIFLIILLECQAVIGLLMPGESLVLVGGFLASQGSFDLDVLIVTIAVAAILGDSIGYELGRWLGMDWLLRHGRWVGIREAHLERVENFFSRHGGKSAFFAHFMHLLRSLVPFAAGSSRMPYRTFFVFNALGCVAWASIFASLGYLLGASWRLAEKWIGRGSAVIGILLALVVVLAWLWRWIVRHEKEIRERWNAFLALPQVARFRERFAPQLKWLQQRLSPQGYLGLHLTLGAMVLIGACWLFGGITEDVLHGDPLTVVDARVAAFFNANATPWLTRTMFAITFTASGRFLTPVAGAVALYLVWRRSWYRLLALVLAVPGGSLLNVIVKHLIHRHRPVFENPIATLNDYSFPSGHTMAATLFCGLMAAFAVVAFRTWKAKTLAVVGAVFMVLLVAFSRVALGLHYLSDVLASMAAGVAWLAFSLTAVETFRRRPENARSAR